MAFSQLSSSSFIDRKSIKLAVWRIAATSPKLVDPSQTTSPTTVLIMARLISVILHVHALSGSRVLVRCGRIVLAHLRLGVGHGALEQLALSRDDILVPH